MLTPRGQHGSVLTTPAPHVRVKREKGKRPTVFRAQPRADARPRAGGQGLAWMGPTNLLTLVSS